MLCRVDDDCLFASAASLILFTLEGEMGERVEGRGGERVVRILRRWSFFDSHFLCVFGASDELE